MKKRILVGLVVLGIIAIWLSIASNKISKNPRIQILDMDSNEIVYLNNFHKSTTEDLDELKQAYIQYILCIEDKDFYKHSGFSIPRIIKSVFNNLTGGNRQGASTITQQYVKNTYLSNKKSITRKIKELYLAIKIENKLSKDEILKEYLSALYFGNSVYGLTNASRYYYNKSVAELSAKEMISFIALWNAPTVYSNNIEKWNEKKNSIAKTLFNNGLLNKAEYQEIRQDIRLNICKEYISSNRQYYIDQVVAEFQKQNIQAKFNEKIILHTCYNPKTENISSALNINYSLLSINKDGYITSSIGDKNYTESTFNISIQGKRDIGSTIKPILYYEAIKCGFENQSYKSEVYSFRYKNETVTVSNSSNTYYSLINMRTAIAVSDNIYAIKTHLTLGMNTLANHLKKYGFEATPYPSLALGSIGMSLKQLSSIYFQFFQEGIYLSPRFIYKIHTGERTVLLKPVYSKLNDAKLCRKIKDLLSAPFDTSIPHATCNSITKKLTSKCYGKSGLTDYDSYMIGFNEDNLVAVWSGNIHNEELLNTEYKRLPKELFYKTMNVL